LSTVTRLRYWFVAALIIVVAVVVGFLSYGKFILRNVLKDAAKAKLGIEYQQSTEGFSLSKSQGGHTLFTVKASKAVTYKAGGRAQLNDVNITVYGHAGDRFDQIYGKQFDYDPQAHTVTADGDVQIDLQSADPNAPRADQAPPKEVKNPVHLRTSGLTFNESTGVAHTENQVEFTVPQANGTAEGVTYDSKARTLTLTKNLHMRRNGPQPVQFWAKHGVINSNQPSKAVFEQVRVERPTGNFEADQLTIFVRPDQSVDHVLADGNLHGSSTAKSKLAFRSQHGEVTMSDAGNVPRRAVFTGDVYVSSTGERSMQGQAKRVVTDFTPDGRVRLVHALEGVHMTQPPTPNSKNGSQAVELTADAVDFFVQNGDTLERAETIGAAEVTSTPTQTAQAKSADPLAKQPGKTTVTAGKFVAQFNQQGRITAVHGAPNARMVSSTSGEPDRVTTSQRIDLAFEPDGSVTNMVQEGGFEYHEAQKTGERAAYAEKASYDPKTEVLHLTGSPRVIDAGMTTTADTVLLNRSTGDAEAQNHVKSTYSDVKPDAQGALFSSSAPVHITARNMTAKRASGEAKYTGDARMWQEANIIEAPTITFDRDRRQLTAASSGSQLVSTILVQTENAQQQNAQPETGQQKSGQHQDGQPGKAPQDKAQPKGPGRTAPVYVKSQKLVYDDTGSVAHFEGAVTLRSSGGNMTAGKIDVFLVKRTTSQPAQPGAAQVDHIVAQNHVRVEQEGRTVTGSKLVYTPADDKFVMTGGPPIITDPQHGTITGSSLTFFRADDKVLVEGGSSRAVTTTRVSR